MNRKVVGILAGCLVALCLCVCAAGAGAYFMRDTIQEMINKQFSDVISGLEPTTVPGLPGKPGLPPVAGTRVAPPGVSSPVAPGGTRVTPATGGGLPNVGGAFGAAVNKTKTASKYRLEFAWVFGGMENGKYQETAFFDMSGEVDNGKSHFVSKGGLLAMLSTDKSTPLEIIEADGKTYMKGMNLGGLMDPKQWYITDNSSSAGFKDFGKPDEFRNFGGKDEDYKKVRTESLDGQSCDVWVYDFKNLKNAAIVGMLGSAKDKSDFSTIDKAEISVWLCGDGFTHKYQIEYAGHDSANANEKGLLRMTGHMWDFNNSSISVSAPAGAKPMPGSK